MCARKECEICKYKDRPKAELPSDNCKERATKNMNILADVYLRDETKYQEEINDEEKREEIYEILIDAMTHQNEACDTKCFVCDYSDRGCCGKIVDAMAKAIYDAGYHPTEKGGVE
jgi:hypothetical protein